MNENGQIEYPRAIPCGFCPKFWLGAASGSGAKRKAAANFPSIIKGLWGPDIFSGLASEMPNNATSSSVRLGDALGPGALHGKS